MTILVYGSGGMGREAAQLIRALHRSAPAEWSFVGFIDDFASLSQTIHGSPVYRLSDAASEHPRAFVTIAVGDPILRAELERRAISAGLRPISLVHPTAEVGENIQLGTGVYIGHGAILTCDLQLGRQVQVNVGCVVHHDCVIGDFVTLSPRVTLLGAVRVGRDVFLGAGALIRQGVSIGDRATIGMGAVVLRDVPSGETWVGVPATALVARS